MASGFFDAAPQVRQGSTDALYERMDGDARACRQMVQHALASLEAVNRRPGKDEESVLDCQKAMKVLMQLQQAMDAPATSEMFRQLQQAMDSQADKLSFDNAEDIAHTPALSRS